MKGIFHERKKVFNAYEFTCTSLTFPEQGKRKGPVNYTQHISFQNIQLVPRDWLVFVMLPKRITQLDFAPSEVFFFFSGTWSYETFSLRSLECQEGEKSV